MRRDRQKLLIASISKLLDVCAATGTIHHKRLNRPLAKYVNNKGYDCHCVEKLTVTTHQLVWLAANGEFDPALQINHKDGNKQNNRLNNLELVTGKQNVAHAIAAARGPSHLTATNVIDIRKLIAAGNKPRFIKDKFQLTDDTFSRIKRCKTFKDFLPIGGEN